MENVNDKNRKLIKALELIGDYELMKPIDEIDGDLIDATVDWSLRLQNKDITLSTEEIEKMVSMIPFDDTEELETNGEVPNSRKVLKKNKVLFIAAVIAILVTLLTIVSVAFEWNIFEELKNRFGTVADTPVNIAQDISGETVIRLGDGERYKTIDEALSGENVDILYPAQLPDGILVDKVTFYYQKGIKNASFVFNNKSLSSLIIFDAKIDSNIIQITTEQIRINGFECYVCEMEDVTNIQIYFQYKGNLYRFSYNDKQELIGIIENLKELE